MMEQGPIYAMGDGGVGCALAEPLDEAARAANSSLKCSGQSVSYCFELRALTDPGCPVVRLAALCFSFTDSTSMDAARATCVSKSSSKETAMAACVSKSTFKEAARAASVSFSSILSKRA